MGQEGELVWIQVFVLKSILNFLLCRSEANAKFWVKSYALLKMVFWEKHCNFSVTGGYDIVSHNYYILYTRDVQGNIAGAVDKISNFMIACALTVS